jgi:hypothetical protein
MRWPSGSISRLAGRLGLTAGGGGAGLAGGLAVTHNPSVAVATAAILAAALSLPRVVESVYKRRPAILKAKGDAKVARIKAASEARALTTRTNMRAKLLLAGLDPDKADQAAEMLRQQSIDADLPEGRRLNDEPLAKLLTAPKTKSSGREPDSGPKGVVRPIR